ncbi:hypothetical protein ACL9RL_16805 [Plantibacter sp. Mn2098]|uniref:hypothetical protein n=1 Tax=Plantibacter sp. Mn2098 TaxID=3395266 RepID=UPI003BE16968
MTARIGRRRLAALAVCIGVGAALCAGCSGPQSAAVPTIASIGSPAASENVLNGIESLPAPKLLAVVGDAVRDARSAHVVGTYSPPPPEATGGRAAEDVAGEGVDAGNRVVSIDVRGSSTTCLGTVEMDGGGSDRVRSEWRRIGDEVFVRGSASFAALIGQEAAEAAFVRFRAGDERIAPWLRLLDPFGPLAGVLETEGSGASIRLGAQGVDRDAQSLQLEMSSDGVLTGTATITTVGPPLPIALAVTDATGRGVFAFDGWGEGADPERPEFVDAALPVE